MAYVVVIRRTADGVTRECAEAFEWEHPDGGDDWFWWTDGNMGCDCNRALCFKRAAGEPTEDDETPCGERAYEILEFRLSDGRVIPGPEA